MHIKNILFYEKILHLILYCKCLNIFILKSVEQFNHSIKHLYSNYQINKIFTKTKEKNKTKFLLIFKRIYK